LVVLSSSLVSLFSSAGLSFECKFFECSLVSFFTNSSGETTFVVVSSTTSLKLFLSGCFSSDKLFSKLKLVVLSSSLVSLFSSAGLFFECKLSKVSFCLKLILPRVENPSFLFLILIEANDVTLIASLSNIGASEKSSADEANLGTVACSWNSST